jgi:hypothetical protein
MLEGTIKSYHNGLDGGGFIAQQRNVVLVGGTSTGKTHLAVAIARRCIRSGGRFCNVVDLINRGVLHALGAQGGANQVLVLFRLARRLVTVLGRLIAMDTALARIGADMKVSMQHAQGLVQMFGGNGLDDGRRADALVGGWCL